MTEQPPRPELPCASFARTGSAERPVDRGRDLVSGPARTLLPMELGRALSHSSNYVVGAFQRQLVAGFLLPFYGCLQSQSWTSGLLCATAEDIFALRQRDPELPFAWRHPMCGRLGSAPDAAYRGVGLTPEGSYVRKRSV